MSAAVPELIGSLSISATVQGIGINTETHEALLADPAAQTLTTFSLLNDAVTSVTFTFQGAQQSTPDLGSAAATPLENLGIAVQNTPTGATGVIADLDSGIVLAQITGLGAQPEAVAVDPASNQGHHRGRRRQHGFDHFARPSAHAAANPGGESVDDLDNQRPTLPLILTGANFSAGAVVRLDQTPICVAGAEIPVAAHGNVCRQITTTRFPRARCWRPRGTTWWTF